jgi:hypothetical protein
MLKTPLAGPVVGDAKQEGKCLPSRDTPANTPGDDTLADGAPAAPPSQAAE